MMERLELDPRRKLAQPPMAERQHLHDCVRQETPGTNGVADQHHLACRHAEGRTAVDGNLVIVRMQGEQVIVAAVAQQIAGPRADHRRIVGRAHGQPIGQCEGFDFNLEFAVGERRESPASDVPGDNLVDDSQPVARGNVVRREPFHAPRLAEEDGSDHR
jgi:hypothetical protein